MDSACITLRQEVVFRPNMNPSPGFPRNFKVSKGYLRLLIFIEKNGLFYYASKGY
jgi:hypothetical protein